MKSYKTPLRYPGGKSRACKKMAGYFPDLGNYEEFREPFLGGGSVSIYITKKYPGHLAGEFLLLYSVSRIFNEVFREPDATLLLGFSRGQFYSFFLMIGGIFVILWSRKKG